jgi:RNA polymerase sigma-B factor
MPKIVAVKCPHGSRRKQALTQPWTESATARDSRVATRSTELRSDVQVPVRESRSPRRHAARRQTDRRRERADFRAYAAHRDREARDRLIRAYLPLADSIARRFDRGGRVPLDDLKQIAALGLLKALERYDPDHGAAFSSFAVPTIEGEIRRYFRDATWSVRLPRHLQERAVRIEREREQLTNDFGRNPTARELAKRIGCTIEEIIDASEASQARASESFDRTVQAQNGDADTLAERLGYEDRGFAAAEATATLDVLLGTLSERDRLLLRLRLREDLTQTEIGRLVGCSQMHVSRILRTALKQLADSAADPPQDPLDPAGAVTKPTASGRFE